MLTIKQPAHYGFKSVHDLPTPPSTSRPSPPLVFQDSVQKPPRAAPRGTSPPSHPMSAPHRGLPPPVAMTLAQPPGPGTSSHPAPPPAPQGAALGQAPPPPPPQQAPQSQHLGQLPPPPQWQGSEDSMRAWLLAKAEEEKRKAEEEKTRQETLRLEQRRMEHDILRTSLQGGIPPPMVPMVFAGIGGGMLPQAALEMAHQFMYSQAQQTAPQQMLPAAPVSPEHRRDSQVQGYAAFPTSGGVPSTPGSAQGPQVGFLGGYPGSPTRPRGFSMPAPAGRHVVASNLPSLNTNVPGGAGGQAVLQGHPGIAPAQQEPQPSPSIYFHHWQPPTSQASQGSSNQPVGESPRNKRKATGPQQGSAPPRERLRSPPYPQSTSSTLSNPPPGRRRGHARQASDLGSYPPAGRSRPESFGSGQQSGSPSGRAATREEGAIAEHQHQHQHQQHQQQQQQQQQQGPSAARSGAHSVSSLLSEEPTPHQASHYPSAPIGNSPRSAEERSRGGAAATRERDDD